MSAIDQERMSSGPLRHRRSIRVGHVCLKPPGPAGTVRDMNSDSSPSLVIRTRSQSVCILVVGLVGCVALFSMAFAKTPPTARHAMSTGDRAVGVILGLVVLVCCLRLGLLRCHRSGRRTSHPKPRPVRHGSVVGGRRISPRQKWPVADGLHSPANGWATDCDLGYSRPWTRRPPPRQRCRDPPCRPLERSERATPTAEMTARVCRLCR
jgi:hypothetical protein